MIIEQLSPKVGDLFVIHVPRDTTKEQCDVLGKQWESKYKNTVHLLVISDLPEEVPPPPKGPAVEEPRQYTWQERLEIFFFGSLGGVEKPEMK